MVEHQLRRRGLGDERVLEAMREVPRDLFVRTRWAAEAYGDHALPIGHGQTISQPYIVALMTTLLEPGPGLRALEIGTGSGYQAAVLAACGLKVYSIERIPELSDFARTNLEAAGYLDRVRLRVGDGSRGWPEAAPFDRIMLTAGAPDLPPIVVEQLAPGGLIVAPVGGYGLQTIYRYREAGGELEKEAIEGARFVPLIESEAEEPT
jgi:protein-L-isoaspartate(D-aspartate) O-methyltransferase